MKLIKIYTERKSERYFVEGQGYFHRSNIPGIVSNYFDNFTLLAATGYYKGQKEDSTIIKLALVQSLPNENKVYSLISDLLTKNSQECVLFVDSNNACQLINLQTIYKATYF